MARSRLPRWVFKVAIWCEATSSAIAATTTFFNSQQVATPVATAVTSDTVSSNSYLFTYTRDKLFTGGLGGGPIGRYVRVPWPTGVEAQAVTTPPPGVTDHAARITLQRVDGGVFDLTAFTAKLLANTAGTGGSIEIMPLVNGEDAFNDPVFFDVTGNYGNSFSYSEGFSYGGNTSQLKGFDTYKIGLFVDFAFTALTLQDASVGISGDFNADGRVDGADFLGWQRGDSPNGGNAADLVAWQTNFGVVPASGAAQSIPEPASLALLISAIALLTAAAPR